MKATRVGYLLVGPALVASLITLEAQADTTSAVIAELPLPLADPTRPANLLVPTGPNGISVLQVAWSLDSVLVSSARRVAVVNGQPSVVGDLVRAGNRRARVTAIEADHVRLLEVATSKAVRIPVAQSSVRKPSRR